MKKLLICGINGRIGSCVCELADYYGFLVVGGVDKKAAKNQKSLKSVRVYDKPRNVTERVDAVIDFSSPELADLALDFCKKNSAALVCGTTALKPDFYAKAKEAAKSVPICVDVNFSASLHAVLRAANLLNQSLSGYDKALIETHGAQKKDAPSGTALLLSQKLAIKQVFSVRGGNAAGEHKITFFGEGEQVEVIHRASDKSVFAKGALLCLSRLLKEKVGYFTADDLLK